MCAAAWSMMIRQRSRAVKPSCVRRHRTSWARNSRYGIRLFSDQMCEFGWGSAMWRCWLSSWFIASMLALEIVPSLKVTYPLATCPSTKLRVVNVLGCLQFWTIEVLAACPWIWGMCWFSFFWCAGFGSVRSKSNALSTLCRTWRRNLLFINGSSFNPLQLVLRWRHVRAGLNCNDQTWSKLATRRGCTPFVATLALMYARMFSNWGSENSRCAPGFSFTRGRMPNVLQSRRARLLSAYIYVYIETFFIWH